MTIQKSRLATAVALLMVSSGVAFAEGRTVEINRTNATPWSVDNLAPYPAPQDGWTRYVIHLPYHLGEPITNGPMFDGGRAVELVVGKVMEVDCNTHRGSGQLVEDMVQGWGYSYLRAELNKDVMSTMKGCIPDIKREEFVPFANTRTDYNSALPLVIYAPSDAVLRYRFWTADAEFQEMR